MRIENLITTRCFRQYAWLCKLDSNFPISYVILVMSLKIACWIWYNKTVSKGTDSWRTYQSWTGIRIVWTCILTVMPLYWGSSLSLHSETHIHSTSNYQCLTAEPRTRDSPELALGTFKLMLPFKNFYCTRSNDSPFEGEEAANILNPDTPNTRAGLCIIVYSVKSKVSLVISRE